MKTRTVQHQDHQDTETLLKDEDGNGVWAVTACDCILTNADLLHFPRPTSEDIFRVYRKIWGDDGLVRELKK